MTERWSATERIFHAALERPVEARAAFLAEACGDDAELRREVQSLLDEASSTSFLEQPALQVAAGLVTSTSIASLTGQRIGVYSITELLGRGGMGEVYRARDTRLGREVAIKVLPPALTAHPDRLARFEREARVLASLNHPHIGMLHGLEESGGHRALVLELVEGETLAERLTRGPIPVKQALTWARQIADALDAAHEKGIVHRDLKPANIKITPQDVVKVLDFGLARTYSGGSDGAVTSTPTITIEAGLIVGTAAYMSPEQARGQAVDKRADVWAFGCVLYELVTGRLAFAGATVADTLSAVLHQDPDWRVLPAGLPPSIATLLRRCLEKDVRQRRRDIGDVRAELDDALARPASATLPAIGTGAAWSRDGRWVFFTVSSTGRTSPCIYKVPVEGGEPVRVRCDAVAPSISSDGATLYYSRRPGWGNEIFKASPPDGDGVPLQGYAASRIPSWPTHNSLSPDDRWLAMPLKDGATTNIWALPTAGGALRQITDFGERAILIARTVSWSADSQSVYAAVAEMDADIVLLEGIGQTPH